MLIQIADFTYLEISSQVLSNYHYINDTDVDAMFKSMFKKKTLMFSGKDLNPLSYIGEGTGISFLSVTAGSECPKCIQRHMSDLLH